MVQTASQSIFKTIKLRREVQSGFVIHVNELVSGKVSLFEIVGGREEISPSPINRYAILLENFLKNHVVSKKK
mgnify:FL=1